MVFLYNPCYPFSIDNGCYDVTVSHGDSLLYACTALCKVMVLKLAIATCSRGSISISAIN